MVTILKHFDFFSTSYIFEKFLETYKFFKFLISFINVISKISKNIHIMHDILYELIGKIYQKLDYFLTIFQLEHLFS